MKMSEINVQLKNGEPGSCERVCGRVVEGSAFSRFSCRGESASEKIGAKIRDAQLQKVPFMLVLGDLEMEQRMVAVRERARGDIGVMSAEEFKEMARRLVETRALTNN